MFQDLKFSSDTKILLVGERNFSFAVNLCVTMDYCTPQQMVATCFENKEDLTAKSIHNSNLLIERGAEVFFSIDGTSLDTYFLPKFSFVVFNFPHSGGKMKIHKNRQLLREFFKSAEKVLLPHGVVIVTLCSGQGGIPLDTKIRRWDDTWQVVSMASFADFVLTSVNVFDPSMFYDYSCSGYRSLDKGFHQKDSVIFRFSKSVPEGTGLSSNPLSTCSVDLFDGSSISVPQYLYSCMQINIFKAETFFKFSLSYITAILRTTFSVNIKTQKIFHRFESFALLADECINRDELNVFPVICLNSDLTDLEVYCVLMNFSPSGDNLEAFLNFKFSLEVHNTSQSWTPHWKTFTFSDICIDSNLKEAKPPTHNVKASPHFIILNLSTFSTNIFGVQSNELWIQSPSLRRENDIIVYRPYSLFPQVYNYHLSFWLPPLENDFIPSFHRKIKRIIVNLVRDALVKVSLLSEHETPGLGRRSVTYEIIYCSHSASLSKDKAKSLHFKVGTLLEHHLGCRIR